MKNYTYKMATAGPPQEIAPRRFRGLASTTALDRDKDHVLAWDVSEFQQNPVLLLNHDITKPIGKVIEVTDSGRALAVVFELLPEGVSEDADFAYGALRHGTLRGLSIGFAPVPGSKKPNTSGGFDYAKVVVFELSLVALQSNPLALAAMVGGKAPVLRLRSEETKAPRAGRGLRVDGRPLTPALARELIHEALPRRQRQVSVEEARLIARDVAIQTIGRETGCLDFY